MDYFGLPAISKRLGISQSTVMRWYAEYGLAMFQRYKAPRYIWYTNDAMIVAWQLKRAETERKAWLSRPKHKRRQSVATPQAVVRQTMK